MISACLDTQEANAKRVLPDGYVGLLTYNLVSTLSESNRDLTYYTLGKILNAKIKDQAAHQTPQVLGNVSGTFLDSRVYVKYASRGIGNLDDDRRTKVFIDGFDGEDTSAIESAFDKAGQFATIVDEMDKIGKDTLIFKNKTSEDYSTSGSIMGSVLSGIGKSQKELWQTPPAKEAVELGNRLYCFTALGTAFRDIGSLVSVKDSKLEPKLTLDDSAASYASAWPTNDNEFQYVLQITDEASNGIWIRYKLSVKRDCYGFILGKDQKGDPEIICPEGNSEPLLFSAGNLEIPIETQIDNEMVKGSKIFPGRYVLAIVVFEKQDAAVAALRSFKQGYALPISTKSGEVSYILIDTEK
jgi:hypothetical protein